MLSFVFHVFSSVALILLQLTTANFDRSDAVTNAQSINSQRSIYNTVADQLAIGRHVVMCWEMEATTSLSGNYIDYYYYNWPNDQMEPAFSLMGFT